MPVHAGGFFLLLMINWPVSARSLRVRRSATKSLPIAAMNRLETCGLIAALRVALQLPPSPMWVFPLRIKNPFNVAVQARSMPI
jgi:hypothetical protein